MSLSFPILVSNGCYKLPLSWWLKTSEILSLTVLEDRCTKSVPFDQSQGVGTAICPLGTRGEHLFLVSSDFWWLLAFLRLWPHQPTVGLCGVWGHVALSSVCVKPAFASLL